MHISYEVYSIFVQMWIVSVVRLPFQTNSVTSFQVLTQTCTCVTWLNAVGFSSRCASVQATAMITWKHLSDRDQSDAHNTVSRCSETKHWPASTQSTHLRCMLITNALWPAVMQYFHYFHSNEGSVKGNHAVTDLLNICSCMCCRRDDVNVITFRGKIGFAFCFMRPVHHQVTVATETVGDLICWKNGKYLGQNYGF